MTTLKSTTGAASVRRGRLLLGAGVNLAGLVLLATHALHLAH